MQTLGLKDYTLDAAMAAPSRRKSTLVSPGYQTTEASRGWFSVVREGFAGAWQRNIRVSTEDVLTYAAVYACVTLKTADIAKLRPKYMERDENGIWTEKTNTAFSPVLRKPNHFQTWQQFAESWMASKFIHGNAYILKARNNRGGESQGNVTSLYPLDPRRVRVLVTPNGDVYYALSTDSLAHVGEAIVVPASEIIHDLMVPLFHPLCGVSPITACGLAATQGLRVQNQSAKFFEQGSLPSGVVSMPDEIDDEQAREIQKRWEDQFSGDNAGRVAVLGFGMKYDKLTMTAVDSQLIDQLKWTSENVCTAHHVPPYMIGVGPPPAHNNAEILNMQYYSQALQSPIEHMEALLDLGLEMSPHQGVELDLDGLLRMDTSSRMLAAEKALRGGMSPDETRRKFHDLGPAVGGGGGTPYLQEQNYSLAALAKRDAREDPFAKGATAAPPAAPAPDDSAEAEDDAVAADKMAADLVFIKTASLVLTREYEHGV